MINLFSLSSQLNSVKTQSLTQKYSDTKANSLWQQRKDNGTYEKMAEVNAELASMQEYVDQLNADAGTMLERMSSNTPSLDAITAKLTSGQELSSSEMEYLKSTNPQLYAKAMQLAAERKNYEEQMKRCETKEDVQRVRTTFLSNALARAKEDPIFSLARANAINNETAEFVKTPEYAEKPTEAERNEELKAERKERDEQVMPEEETAVQSEQKTEDSRPSKPDGKTEEADEQPLPDLPGQGTEESTPKADFKKHKAAPDPDTGNSKPEHHADKTQQAKAHHAYKQSMDSAKEIRRRG